MEHGEGKQPPDSARARSVRFVGRYALLGKLAAGGMATVHVGRLVGPVGFSRMVAVKRLHPEYARDPEFVSMFLDEARVASKFQHPNVVSTLDVVATGGELYLVMDYVHGQSLSWLVKQATKLGEHIPPRIVTSIISGCLQGLHAAHEARDERGVPLNIVHRDVSPQNVMVGADGLARVLDFGVAKAAGRMQHTREGRIKGKLAYMPPEQLQSDFIDRKADIYATAVVLWETLTMSRLFKGATETSTLMKVLGADVPPPSKVASWVPPELDAIVLRGLDRDVTKRWSSAREMALALERAGGVASTAEVSDWLERIAKSELEERASRIAALEMEAGLARPPGKESLARVLAASPITDDEVETRARLDSRRDELENAETKSADISALHARADAEAEVDESLTVPRSSRTASSEVARPAAALGDMHTGDSASQLSTVGVAVGDSVVPPHVEPRRQRPLFTAMLVGLLAAAVGATLWLTTARRSIVDRERAAAAPSQAVTASAADGGIVAPSATTSPSQ